MYLCTSFCSKPSISTSSWCSVFFVWPSHCFRVDPIASISSMNMMQGAWNGSREYEKWERNGILEAYHNYFQIVQHKNRLIIQIHILKTQEIDGAVKTEQTFFLAAWNKDLTRRAPTPTNLEYRKVHLLYNKSVSELNALGIRLIKQYCIFSSNSWGREINIHFFKFGASFIKEWYPRFSSNSLQSKMHQAQSAVECNITSKS